MTSTNIANRYFEWMCSLVYDSKNSRSVSYKKLLKKLHEIDFVYIIGQDVNRFDDGVDLRYRFGYENNISKSDIENCIDNRPCSILEMMIALSLRCEEHIMGDDDIGNRTGQWFWNMIVNLGLGSMTDQRFDDDYVIFCIDRFLNREYEPDGEGGLVTIPNCRQDLRTIEIWYQMMWYLSYVLKN